MDELQIATIVDGHYLAGPLASSGQWAVLSVEQGEVRSGHVIRFRREDAGKESPSPSLNVTTGELIVPRFHLLDADRDHALLWMTRTGSGGAPLNPHP